MSNHPDQLLNNGLPSHIESEKAVLGAILLKSELIDQARKLLSVTDFFLQSHQVIYRRMLQLKIRGGRIDHITLSSALQDAQELERIGNITYLASLADGLPQTDDITYYAQIIREKALLRRLLRISEDISARCLSGEEVVSVLSYMQGEIDRVSNDVFPTKNILKFRTAKEIAQQTPEKPDWIAQPYIASGALTEVVGKIKAAGKTTLITHLCRAVLDGNPFLGWQTKQTGIVYLSEQPTTTFREALRRANLLDCENFTVLFSHDIRDMQWPDVVRAAISECKQRGARLLVIDTLSQFVGMRGDAENTAGEALAAIQPLQEAAAIHGLAVVIIRHERKGGGNVGDSGRGSSAFGGAVDVVISLRRAEGNSSPSVRLIHALSRFDETPDTLTIELTESGYDSLGSETDIAIQQAKKTINDVLPNSAESAISLEQILAATNLKRTLTQDALKALITHKRIQKIGDGKRGDPFRYCLIAENNSAAPSNLVVAERNADDVIHPAATTSLYPAQRKEVNDREEIDL